MVSTLYDKVEELGAAVKANNQWHQDSELYKINTGALKICEGTTLELLKKISNLEDKITQLKEENSNLSIEMLSCKRNQLLELIEFGKNNCNISKDMVFWLQVEADRLQIAQEHEIYLNQ